MTVFRRTGSPFWQCKFTLDGVTVRETTGCKNKIDAQAWEVRRREKIKAEVRAEQRGYRNMTLYALAESWLKASERVHRDYRNNISRVRKLFGDELRQVRGRWQLASDVRPGLPKDITVAALTQTHLVNLKAARLKEGLSFATVNREIALVQTLIGYAASLMILTPEPPLVWSCGRNKAASLKLPERNVKLRWLTIGEEAALLTSLQGAVDLRSKDQAAIDAYVLTTLLLDTGGRYSEIAQLRWSHVDLQSGTLNLYRSKVQNESMLRLPQRSLRLLRDRWEAMEGRGYSYVFPKLNGRSWAGLDLPRGHSTYAIQKHIDLCGFNTDQKAGKVTPHTFRDTYAARLVQAGVSLQKVSQLLGHSNIVMTQKYAHLCPDALGAEAVEVLNKLHSMTPIV